VHSGQGQLVETFVDSGGRIVCPPELIPVPGQYLLAHTDVSDSPLAPLAVPIFFSESAPNGFRAAASLPAAWRPGARLFLRGPLGRGFVLPSSARRVALIAFDDSASRLHGLIPPALKAGAAITLVCDGPPEDLSEEVEAQPLKSMREAYAWADYAAIDVARENLPGLWSMLDGAGQAQRKAETQVLVRTPMPCGAMAECGVCAVVLKDSWIMICRDGPVFDFAELKNLPKV